MADAIRTLESRLSAWDWGAWNHPRRAMLLTPLLILAGAAASVFLQTELAHRGYTVGPDGALTAAFIMISLVGGYVVLALVD